MIRQLSPLLVPSCALRACPAWSAAAAQPVRDLTTDVPAHPAPSQQQPLSPAASQPDNAAPGQQDPSGSRRPAAQHSAYQAKHPSTLVRIAPTRPRPVDMWTAFDVLSFLQDPAVTVSDLRVEYNNFIRPMAWWVRYDSAEKAARVVQTLGRPGQGTRLGTTDVSVVYGDMSHLEATRSRLDAAGGHVVLCETDQQLNVDMVEHWLQGFQLSETRPRVRVLHPSGSEDAKGKRLLARAFLTFSSPEEAQMATWKLHKQILGSAPVWLRVLP